jgi:phosphoglycolate phosphatase
MQTICFDLDGTLTDPKLGITRSIQYALQELTGAAPEADALTWCIGPPLLGSFETLLGERRDEAPLALAKYRERYGEIGLFENEVYPGIIGLLSGLAEAGHRVIVATSKPHVYARRIVEHFELSRFFEDVCGAELSGERSDKTELLRWVIDAKGIAADQAIMVGDREHDVIGARNNGMRAIGVTYGYGTEAELTQAGAAALCRSPEELRPLLSD